MAANPKPKTILITGCSAHGIGAALALNLARRGHFIFATARSPTKIPKSLTSLENVRALPLDVTDPATIADAMRAVTEHGRGLDILVNNAGAGYTMPLLEADMDRVMEVSETNVWGPLRVIQACSDLLVASKGRIINISSAGAAVHTPWIGVYSSAKAALVQMSETLRLEIAPFGVSVVCIMAGTVATAFHANESEVVLPPTSRYAAVRQIIYDFAMGQHGLKSCSADEFAASIVDDVLGVDGGVVWRGPYSSIVKFLSSWCPTWLLDRLMMNGKGMDELAKQRNN